jgi:CBS domain-containing protein
MTTARDIMTPDTQCVGEHDSLTEAARKMRDLDVGALPICGDDHRLKGMVTDRDIALSVADGRDVSTEVIDLTAHEVVTIGADDSLEEAMRTMAQHQVRRLPVIDGHDLVGMISQADIARNVPDDKVGDLVAAISSAPANA